jgi:hypothetical protein
MPAPINVFFRPFLALAVALACVLTTQSIQAAEPANGGAMTAGTMMEQCKAMQAHKQQMMADMKAQDTALSEQVAQMNSTTDDKKLGLLAALVTRMAEQRIARDTHMAAMSDEMMKHMMQHMQMGKESMQGCPMMKGMGMNDMKGMDDKSSDPAKGQK